MTLRGMRAGGVAVLAAMAMTATAPDEAAGGGFSAVTLDTPPPERIEPGDAWTARFTVLAHGRTPLPGLRPAVRLEAADGGAAAQVFRARETAVPGTYRAQVTFPDTGAWRVEVLEHPALNRLSGHSFGEVRVGGDGAADFVVALALGLLAGALAWLALIALRRPRELPARTAAKRPDAVR